MDEIMIHGASKSSNFEALVLGGLAALKAAVRPGNLEERSFGDRSPWLDDDGAGCASDEGGLSYINRRAWAHERLEGESY